MLSKRILPGKGNLIAAGGMVLAILGKPFFSIGMLMGNSLHNLIWFCCRLIIGTIVGLDHGKEVQMTSMPSNGFFLMGWRSLYGFDIHN